MHRWPILHPSTDPHPIQGEREADQVILLVDQAKPMCGRVLLSRLGENSPPEFLGLTTNPKNAGALLSIIRAPPPDDAFFWIFTDSIHFMTRFTGEVRTLSL
jgi:hypothetical protein